MLVTDHRREECRPQRSAVGRKLTAVTFSADEDE